MPWRGLIVLDPGQIPRSFAELEIKHWILDTEREIPDQRGRRNAADATDDEVIK